LTQRETKKTFSRFYFSVSDRQAIFFHCWTKTFNAAKIDERFSLFCCSFRPDKKNDSIFFSFLFQWTREISKTKNPRYFFVYCERDRKNFLKFKTVDKTENADNSGFAAIAG
jgi:hypothetical protein